jgi:hypothetical protein
MLWQIKLSKVTRTQLFGDDETHFADINGTSNAVAILSQSGSIQISKSY